MDPSEILIPIDTPFLGPGGKVVPVWWKYLVDLAHGLGTVDLTSQVTGVLPYTNGGTSHADLQLTTTGATNVTLPTSGTLLTKDSPITAVTLNVTTSVSADSGGIKHARVTTGVIAGGASALVTVNWGTAFASTAYTVVASVLDSTAGTAALSVVHVETQAVGSVAVRVQNTSGGNLTGTLHVIALHD